MNMPSFYIADLAKVIADHYGNGNTSITEIGIREGEKLDEVLISEHEVSRTFVYNNDYYVISPDLKLPRDYGHLESLDKPNFKEFSSSTKLSRISTLKTLLYNGGFLS